MTRRQAVELAAILSEARDNARGAYALDAVEDVIECVAPNVESWTDGRVVEDQFRDWSRECACSSCQRERRDVEVVA